MLRQQIHSEVIYIQKLQGRAWGGSGTCILLMEIQGAPHHVLGKQSPGRCTYHNSINMCLQLTTEVIHVPTKAPGCLAYSLNLNDTCPLRVTTDITLYEIIMQILNI